MKKTLSLTILAGMLAIGANGAWADGPYPTNLTSGAYGPVGQVTPNSNTNEYEIYNAVNQLLGTSYTNNAQVDNLEYNGNTTTWQQTGTGGYAVIGLGAGNANTFDVYNSATPGTLISPIGGSFSGNGSTGAGTSSSPYVGAQAVFSAGTQFGLAVNTVGVANIAGTASTPAGGTTWYSNTALNSDLMDHMITYNLSSLNGAQVYVYNTNTSSTQLVTLEDPYLVGFEDLPLNNNGAGSDQDYNDLLVLVNGAAPVAPVPEPMTFALFGVGLLSMASFAAFAVI